MIIWLGAKVFRNRSTNQMWCFTGERFCPVVRMIRLEGSKIPVAVDTSAPGCELFTLMTIFSNALAQGRRLSRASAKSRPPWYTPMTKTGFNCASALQGDSYSPVASSAIILILPSGNQYNGRLGLFATKMSCSMVQFNPFDSAQRT
jgi:hypothetical protein